jgi:nicotinamidase-related amidase
MLNFTLEREKTALLVVDVQERLFNFVERPCEVMQAMQQAIKGFQILNLPIFVTEQYPKGLGHTIGALKSLLGDAQEYLTKTSFSCCGDAAICERLLAQTIDYWVVIGIEAHICVLQTAKSLLGFDKKVVVLNDAISSRSIYNFSTAIAELRDCGARVSCVEAILFELLKDSQAAEFKQISELIK